MKIDNIEIITPHDNNRASCEEYDLNGRKFYVFVVGKYQSLAKQVAKEKLGLLDAETYYFFYKKAIVDFKTKYRNKNSKEFTGKDQEIIKGFGQICITQNGLISLFVEGVIQFFQLDSMGITSIDKNTEWIDNQQIILCNIEGTTIANSIRDLYFDNNKQDFEAKIQQFPYCFYLLKYQKEVSDIEPKNQGKLKESVEKKETLVKKRINPLFLILLFVGLLGIGISFFLNQQYTEKQIFNKLFSTRYHNDSLQTNVVDISPKSIVEMKFKDYLSKPDSVEILATVQNLAKNDTETNEDIKENIRKEIDYQHSKLIKNAQKYFLQAEIYLQNGEEAKALAFYYKSEKQLTIAKKLKPNMNVETDKVLQKINLIKNPGF